VTTDLALLTTHLLRAVVVTHSINQQHVKMLSPRVDCSGASVAPSFPLFHSLLRMLENLLPRALMLAHCSRTRDSLGSQIQHDATVLRNLIFKSQRYSDIASAIQILESSKVISASWRRDFIAITLGYSSLGHTEEELKLLDYLSFSLPGLCNSSSCDKESGLLGESSFNIFRWLLLKDELRVHLFESSQLLISVKGILSVGDFLETLKGTDYKDCHSEDGERVKGAGITVEKANDVQQYDLESQTLIYSQTVSHILHICVQKLWDIIDRLIRPQATSVRKLLGFVDRLIRPLAKDEILVEGDVLNDWLKCVRDLQTRKEFSVSLLLEERERAEDEEGILSGQDCRLFFAMTIVHNIVGVTGLSIGDLKAAKIFDDDSFSSELFDPLGIILDLLASATTAVELNISGMSSTDIDSQKAAHTVVANVAIDCFDWLLKVPSAITHCRHSKTLLLYGLLGVKSDTTFTSTYLEFISLNARCDFLARLMVDEEIHSLLHDLLESKLIRGMSTVRSGGRIESSNVTYIPTVPAVAVTESVIRNVFKDKVRLDPHYLSFMEETEVSGRIPSIHTIVFRTVFLSDLKESSAENLSDAADAFKSAVVANAMSQGVLSHMKSASRTMLLLKMSAEILSNGGLNSDTVFPFGSSSNGAAVAAAIAIAPRVWSMYFLSRLRDIGTITLVLHSKVILEELGIAWLYSEPPSEMLLSAEIPAQREAQQYLAACLTAIIRAKVSVTFESQRLEMQPSTIEIMLRQAQLCLSATVSADTDLLQRKGAELTCLLAAADIQSALSMNRHIPIIAAMHIFLREKLAYRLKE
jgi:hypothetical protein